MVVKAAIIIFPAFAIIFRLVKHTPSDLPCPDHIAYSDTPSINGLWLSQNPRMHPGILKFMDISQEKLTSSADKLTHPNQHPKLQLFRKGRNGEKVKSLLSNPCKEHTRASKEEDLAVEAAAPISSFSAAEKVPGRPTKEEVERIRIGECLWGRQMRGWLRVAAVGWGRRREGFLFFLSEEGKGSWFPAVSAMI